VTSKTIEAAILGLGMQIKTYNTGIRHADSEIPVLDMQIPEIPAQRKIRPADS